MSFVGQAYPGIQLSANEKKSGGSICSARAGALPGNYRPGRSGEVVPEGRTRSWRRSLPACSRKGLSRPEFFKISLLCRIKRGPFKPASVRIGVAGARPLLLLSPAVTPCPSLPPSLPFVLPPTLTGDATLPSRGTMVHVNSYLSDRSGSSHTLLPPRPN